MALAEILMLPVIVIASCDTFYNAHYCDSQQVRRLYTVIAGRCAQPLLVASGILLAVNPARETI